MPCDAAVLALAMLADAGKLNAYLHCQLWWRG
jgi:hypothetical protein